MAGLEGTIKTPVGEVSKKTALYVGAGIAVVGGIVWYRGRQNAAASATTDSTDSTGEIDPATGYVYGTPEDEAALEAQAEYDTGANTAGVATGGSTVYPSGTYTTNSEWVQAVISYMTQNDLVTDPTQLTAALGEYINGQYIDPSSAGYSLVQQAIAVQDFPPISGPNGYPPSINTTAPSGGGGGTTSTATPPTPGDMHQTKETNTGITFAWDYPSGSPAPTSQIVYKNGQKYTTISGSARSYTMSRLSPGNKYRLGIAAVIGSKTGAQNFGTWQTANQKG